MTLGDNFACLRQSEWRMKIKNEKRAKISRSFVGCVMHTRTHAHTHTETKNTLEMPPTRPCECPAQQSLRPSICCLLSLALQKLRKLRECFNSSCVVSHHVATCPNSPSKSPLVCTCKPICH